MHIGKFLLLVAGTGGGQRGGRSLKIYKNQKSTIIDTMIAMMTITVTDDFIVIIFALLTFNIISFISV